MAAKFEAVGTRQHHVEQKQSRHFAKSLGENRGAADETLHFEPRRLQVMRDEAGDEDRHPMKHGFEWDRADQRRTVVAAGDQ